MKTHIYILIVLINFQLVQSSIMDMDKVDQFKEKLSSLEEKINKLHPDFYKMVTDEKEFKGFYQDYPNLKDMIT